VPKDEKAILQYLRAVRDDFDEGAPQLRSFVGSALQVAASDFDLADLVNADSSGLQLSEFEARLRHAVEAQVRATYGIGIDASGVERLTLPETTLNATVARMRSERETIAVQRTADGQRRGRDSRRCAARQPDRHRRSDGKGGRYRSSGAARGVGHLRQGLSERSVALSLAALA
jgi:membrane protease subunit HflC